MKTNKFSNKASKIFTLILIGSLSIISPAIALAQVVQPVSAPITIPVPVPVPTPSATPQPTPVVTPTPTPAPVVKYNVSGQIISTYRGPLIYNPVVARNTRTGQVYRTTTGFNGTFSFKLTNGNYVITPTRGSNMITFTPSGKTVIVNGQNINNVTFSYQVVFRR